MSTGAQSHTETDSYPSRSHSTIKSYSNKPRHRMPESDGWVEWKAFCLQFQSLGEYYEWDEDNQLQKLMFSLKGPALDYVAQLPPITTMRLQLLTKALDQRFGDHILPETYRDTLNNTKKQYKETNREYEARIRKLVTKAYLGMEGTDMYQSLVVEHLVMGLGCQILIWRSISLQENLKLHRRSHELH